VTPIERAAPCRNSIIATTAAVYCAYLIRNYRRCRNFETPSSLTSIFLLLRFFNDPFKLLHTLGALGVCGTERIFCTFSFHSSLGGVCACDCRGVPAMYERCCLFSG